MSDPVEPSFQRRIEQIYFARDSARGKQGSLLWFVEEVGELVRAIRRGEQQNLQEEFADVYAWLATLASLHGLDLEEMGRKKYEHGCPRCRALPCACPQHKPLA
ncbi:nucleotide pyrophosphohydrolase [Planctomycetota bacterium]|jgi:NTP pyrophosphatase (non-canonical NTP hydrolase)|nr:nucleotide pyrophosphohydrolase [Planctomycetota bacterium]MSR38690.1 nucleotide pyrophosphohydrolase [Planctomycetota bacterium]GDY01547.1 nucleotide pyrophosphohydrolase [Planctomycetota bacterium]